MTLLTSPILHSHGRTLDTSARRLGPLEPSLVSDPLTRLQARYREQGYLWLRGMLPRAEVLEFRRHFFAALSDTGLEPIRKVF